MEADQSTEFKRFILDAVDSISFGKPCDLLSQDLYDRLLEIQAKGFHTFAPTVMLRNHIVMISGHLTEIKFRQHFNFIYSHLLHWMEHIALLPSGIERAEVVHNLIDFAIRKSDEGAGDRPEISCHKGCSFCCHTQVSIGASEGWLIEDYIDRNSLSWDQDLAFKQSVLKEAKTYNEKLSWAESACVFLSPHGTCNIYDVRPVSCRKVLVVSHPKLCDPRTANSPSYFLHLEAEIIAAAFYNIEIEREGVQITLPDYLSRTLSLDESKNKSDGTRLAD